MSVQELKHNEDLWKRLVVLKYKEGSSAKMWKNPQRQGIKGPGVCGTAVAADICKSIKG